MAIYGTSASDRVTSWMDNVARGTSAQNDDVGQSDSAGTQGNQETLVALNNAEAGRADNSRQPIIVSQSPLEEAGRIPQRQLPRENTRAATDTTPTGERDTTTPVVPPTRETTTDGNQGAGANRRNRNQQTQNQNQTQPQTPVRALW